LNQQVTIEEEEEVKVRKS